MSTKKVIYAILVVFVLGIIALVTYAFSVAPTTRSLSQIDSFDDCVEAGFPVMESYPRQCHTSDGKSFTEEIDNEDEIINRANIEPVESVAPVGTSTNATSS